MIGLITVACISFLIGYILGKRKGEKLGYIQGKAELPLQLRQKSFESGYCVLCKSQTEDGREG